MRFLAVLAIFLMPMQAAALSCVRPSVERTYHEVEKAAETYVIVAGRLTFDRRKLPGDGVGKNDQPKMTRIAGRLVGKSMTKAGFNVPFEQPVTLEVACFGPWCGGAEDGGQVLAFVKRQNGRYALGVNPCGGHIFANPRPAMLKQVVQCYKGRNCIVR